jgi:hypothetical protein
VYSKDFAHDSPCLSIDRVPAMAHTVKDPIAESEVCSWVKTADLGAIDDPEVKSLSFTETGTF